MGLRAWEELAFKVKLRFLNCESRERHEVRSELGEDSGIAMDVGIKVWFRRFLKHGGPFSVRSFVMRSVINTPQGMC